MKVVFALVTLLLVASPAWAQFTEMYDLVPNRCFSAALSTSDVDSVDIGIESGFAAQINKACIASTRPFNAKSVSDTFTVTIAAPVGQTIARVHYEQEGVRYVERPNYWATSGTGSLSVNGIVASMTFHAQPTLVKTIELGEDVTVAHVVVTIALNAYRNSAFPRVTAAPGSATIQVTSGVIRVEYR